MIVATRGDAPGLVAVKEGIFPVPLAGKPMTGLLLVQAYVVPGTGPEKEIPVVVAPLQ